MVADLDDQSAAARLTTIIGMDPLQSDDGSA